jgi:hypothetical protein
MQSLARAAVVLLVSLSVGCAPRTSPARGPTTATAPDSATVEAVRVALRNDLRNFMVAQEAYFAENATYARSRRDMGDMYETSPGVTVVLLTASELGHSEIAIHDRVPGLVCGVFVGTGSKPLGDQMEERRPFCRGP